MRLPDGPTSIEPEPPATGAVRGPSLSQQISDKLIERILRGDLGPGDALPSEEDLAVSFDVSRPVIREAVKELLLLGMVDSRQGRSTRVAPARSWNHFSPRLLAARGRVGAVDDILLELLELRRLIEAGAAGLAAVRASDDAIAEMAAAYERMEASKDDVERFVDADIAFHEAVLSATGNYLLTHLIDTIGPLLRMGRRVSLERRVDGATASQSGHRAVLDAIRAHDATAARQHMREHLSWTAELQLSDLAD